MALTATEWAEIEALYKIGEIPMRDIATKYGITHGAISARAKREKWERGSLKQAVNDMVNSSNQIIQMVTPDQAPIINQVVRDKLQLKSMVSNLIGDSIELQQNIISGTLTKLKNGLIDELQAAKVLQSIGVTFDSITKLLDNTDVSNSIKTIEPVFPDDPIEASRIYQELIKK